MDGLAGDAVADLVAATDPVGHDQILCAGLALAQTGTAQNAAEVLSVSAPASVAPGATFTATITMTNTGGLAWTTAGLYTLSSESPRNNLRWLASGRLALPVDPINPGEAAAFTATFTAPTTAGVYNFSWSMVQEPASDEP